MCGSCDNDDIGVVNELFGALYRLGYSVPYEKPFDDILKQLRHDACSMLCLRKYSIKLDGFTDEWMQHMSGWDVMEGRHLGDDMSWQQMVDVVKKEEMDDPKKREEVGLRPTPPLFSAMIHNKRRRLPSFLL
jgi:hypothetical protein